MRKPLVIEPSYLSLTQFVRNNERFGLGRKVLSEEEIGRYKEEVGALKNAISRGDYQDASFKYPNADLFIFHLLQQEELPYWPCITAYFCLLVMTYYPEKDIQLIPIRDAANQPTREAQRFLEEVSIKAQHHQYPALSQESIKDFISQLQPSEACFLKVHFTSLPEGGEPLLEIIGANAKFIMGMEGKNALILPPFQFINFLLRSLNPEHPVQILPCFGLIGVDTLRELHEQNVHPLALYHRQVKNNLYGVHGKEDTPVAYLIHDLGHALWMSLLGDRTAIYSFIRVIKKWIEEAEHDLELIKKLKKIAFELLDFDLTPVSAFLDIAPGKRYRYYVKRCCDKTTHQRYARAYELFGNSADQIDFLTFRGLNSSDSAEEKFCSLLVFDLDYYNKPFEASTYRSAEITDCLKFLAQAPKDQLFFPRSPSLISTAIDFEAWKKLVNAASSSQELWMSACREKEREKELIALIREHGLIFFPPFLGVDWAVVKPGLLDFFEKKLNKGVELSPGIFAEQISEELRKGCGHAGFSP